MTVATVLVIDDSKAATEGVCSVLERCPEEYRILCAKDGLDGFKTLVSTKVDIVLCDLLMDGMDGFKFLGLKRSREELIDVPVIMLTGAGSVSEKVKALEGGAADYLTKPFDDAELIARLRVHLKVRSLQRELREKNQKLEELSNTDELTRLANRRYFMRVAEVELMRAQRYGNSLACIIVDLDHFKRVNDTHGHLAGDHVLRMVADAIQRDLRRHDIAARYGGEELVLILPQTTCANARPVAERYRDHIRRLEIRHDGVRIPVTASFGVAAYPECATNRIDDLIAKADAALYEAKAEGRDRVCVAQCGSST